MPSTLLQIIHISVLFFGNVVNKFNTCRQYWSMLFFLNIVTYFVLSKQIWVPNGKLFFNGFHMKVNRCRHLFSKGGQILTFIRKFYEGKNRILVVGYSYLFCQYEIRACSMSSGRQRFFIVRAQNAIRCRADDEDSTWRHVESSSSANISLSVLCSETRQWWRTFRNRCNSKPANRASDQR